VGCSIANTHRDPAVMGRTMDGDATREALTNTNENHFAPHREGFHGPRLKCQKRLQLASKSLASAACAAAMGASFDLTLHHFSLP
jgi:hypothetical protein